MKEILGFIRSYYAGTNKAILLVSTLFTAFLVWINYSFNLEHWLLQQAELPWSRVTGHFLVYVTAFLFPYLLLYHQLEKKKSIDLPFLLLLLLAPLIFAIKVGLNSSMHLTDDNAWNQYWNSIVYWPVRLGVLVAMLGACRFLIPNEARTYGLQAKQVNLKPYLLMLLVMVPLIAAASSQPDFLATYPKMKTVTPLPGDASPSWIYKLLFELSYGSDFFSIEIFFRGFLVLGFIKWAGRDAILPMACFYCTIHFGKPLAECISSYFGGLLLGIISYHTRSIYGGLIVHLGIAWLMEIGGYIGHAFSDQ